MENVLISAFEYDPVRESYGERQSLDVGRGNEQVQLVD
jgi:hypothetical protein